MNVSNPGESDRDRPDLSSIVRRITASMAEGRLGPGDLAQLKRLDVSRPDQPAFWKLEAELISPDAPLSLDAESRWAVVLKNMARMAPFHHRPRRPLGTTLAEAGFAEGRMNRLLREKGDGLWDAFRRACAFLAARAEPVDWVETATFILTTDAEKAENIRRKIARDYFQRAQKKEGQK